MIVAKKRIIDKEVYLCRIYYFQSFPPLLLLRLSEPVNEKIIRVLPEVTSCEDYLTVLSWQRIPKT